MMKLKLRKPLEFFRMGNCNLIAILRVLVKQSLVTKTNPPLARLDDILSFMCDG